MKRTRFAASAISGSKIYSIYLKPKIKSRPSGVRTVDKQCFQFSGSRDQMERLVAEEVQKLNQNKKVSLSGRCYDIHDGGFDKRSFN